MFAYKLIYCLFILPKIFSLPWEENFQLYLTRETQVLTDTDSPVYQTYNNPLGYDGVGYSLVKGYPMQMPQKPTLKDELLKYLVLPVNIVYLLHQTKVHIQIATDASFTAQHISGPNFDFTAEDYVQSYLEEIKSKQLPNVPGVFPKPPDTVYPEILVVVHYDLFELLGKDVDVTVNYVTEFWAKVDVRFRPLQRPKVRLHIAGIIIASKGSAPYVLKMVPDYNELAQELNRTAKHFDRQRYIPDNYDVIMIMHKFYHKDPAHYNVNFKTTGIANLASACKTRLSPHGNIIKAVALFGDDGHYDGVQVAAHELAHVLGAVHDHNTYIPELKRACLRHPKAAFIMTYRVFDDYIYGEFSPCSLSTMQYFLNTRQATCLYNKPLIKRSPTLQTLKRYTTLEQCHMKFGTKWNFMQKPMQNICQSVDCYSPVLIPHPQTGIPTWFNSTELLYPVDGTICGYGKVCLKNSCIPQPKGIHIIPEGHFIQ